MLFDPETCAAVVAAYAPKITAVIDRMNAERRAAWESMTPDQRWLAFEKACHDRYAAQDKARRFQNEKHNVKQTLRAERAKRAP